MAIHKDNLPILGDSRYKKPIRYLGEPEPKRPLRIEERVEGQIGLRPTINRYDERGCNRKLTDAEQAILTEYDNRYQVLARNEYIKDNQEVFTRCIGPRYDSATLDNYSATTANQKAALASMKAYAANLREEVTALGTNIVLFGSTGTGKDHLLVGLARLAIAEGCPLKWANGVELHAEIRAAFGNRDSENDEEAIVSRYTDIRVLILSDPVPPAGSLTDFQATTLYRIIDARYRFKKPTWTTLNVKDVAEARERLGAAVVDRLRDGAIAIHCDWQSHRKARK